MPEYTPEFDQLKYRYQLDVANSPIAGRTFEEAGDEFDRAIAAHDAVVRADQAEKDGLFARKFFRTAMLEGGGYWGDRFALELRAVVLTATTKETEQ